MNYESYKKNSFTVLVLKLPLYILDIKNKIDEVDSRLIIILIQKDIQLLKYNLNF